MTIKEQIEKDFIDAYKSKNMVKKNFLAVLKGALQTQEGKMIPSTDENVLKVIKTFEKGILETIEAKIKLNQNTSDMELELSFLKPYQPELMSEDEIRMIIDEMISRPSLNNQGFIMGVFNKENKGKAFDNKLVLKIITEKLK